MDRRTALIALAGSVGMLAFPAYSKKSASADLIFESSARLAVTKANLGAYAKSLKSVLGRANAALGRAVDTVTNKTQTPPSGDKHDYMSVGPYWWPDPNKPDGLPWIRRDGETNPMTRGPDTDKSRTSRMFGDLSALNMAYAMTDEAKYADKMKAILLAWLVTPATRMNPNLNFAQAVPGQSEGRPFGIIEWTGIDNVVTAVQLLDQKKALTASQKAALDTWLGDYFNWLTTSKLGREEEATPNNHGTWFDVQAIGLALYLGKNSFAKEQAEKAKTRRIAAQIEPDGRQPHELERTKSVSYSTMNLWAMLRIAELARRVKVDLFSYQTNDGRSIGAAVRYLLPYAEGTKSWEHEQIEGGAQKAIDERLLPMLARAEILLGERLLSDPVRAKAHAEMDAGDRLSYGIGG